MIIRPRCYQNSSSGFDGGTATFAYLPWCESSVSEAVAAAPSIDKGPGSRQALANAVWAVATARVPSSLPEAAVAALSPRGAAAFGDQELLNVLWACGALTVRPPEAPSRRRDADRSGLCDRSKRAKLLAPEGHRLLIFS